MSVSGREEALHALEIEYGISGELIYLLPIVPLIGMLWADGKNHRLQEQIIDYCMDIAAATVTHYPYNKRDRFIVDENALSKELCESLG